MTASPEPNGPDATRTAPTRRGLGAVRATASVGQQSRTLPPTHHDPHHGGTLPPGTGPLSSHRGRVPATRCVPCVCDGQHPGTGGTRVRARKTDLGQTVLKNGDWGPENGPAYRLYESATRPHAAGVTPVMFEKTATATATRSSASASGADWLAWTGDGVGRRDSTPRSAATAADTDSSRIVVAMVLEITTSAADLLRQNRNSRVNLTTNARFSRNGVPRSDVSRWSL